MSIVQASLSRGASTISRMAKRLKICRGCTLNGACRGSGVAARRFELDAEKVRIGILPSLECQPEGDELAIA
ncbi:hypothetical protein [Mesorhizobium australafricanum]|uniref:Uncharacterized protein n=1 Tax=Mesorhizobium australafricanum TaxID=3072311 RepID=A0ABU4X2N2_9HYPH|nr:hypothetical protein [Mesorhizobium sp. VK3E]MDX8442575.1 hypothetical protein [Mesorhizobium sp. VK3E]